MPNRTADVAIVGAGILGLAHGDFAARPGKSIVVFERHPRATGASGRNFGMILAGRAASWSHAPDGPSQPRALAGVARGCQAALSPAWLAPCLLYRRLIDLKDRIGKLIGSVDATEQ